MGFLVPDPVAPIFGDNPVAVIPDAGGDGRAVDLSTSEAAIVQCPATSGCSFLGSLDRVADSEDEGVTPTQGVG